MSQTARMSVSKVPLVAELLEIEEEIKELKAKHPDLFAHLQELIDDYNDKLAAAEKEVRALGVSCGPFIASKTIVRYDAEKMFDELGQYLFLEAGGVIEKRAVYSIDKNKLEAAIASGVVPEESVSQFKTESHSYRTPKKMSL